MQKYKILNIFFFYTLYNIPPNTIFVGKNIIFLPTCHSTNDIATELINSKKAIEGDIIITSHQTAGRGQKGNKWEAEPHKNITLSLILFPKYLKASEQFYLNMAMSLAVYEFLNIFLPDNELKIKWPNDIKYGKQKLSGMLIENTVRGYNLESSIIGIGININQENFNEGSATSLKKIIGKEYNLEEILNPLLEKIEKNYLKIKNFSFADLKEKYLKYQYQYNDNKIYQTAEGGKIVGKIIDVDDTGRLCIQNISGDIIKYNFKEIIFL